jgi:hypothetical protein
MPNNVRFELQYASSPMSSPNFNTVLPKQRSNDKDTT